MTDALNGFETIWRRGGGPWIRFALGDPLLAGAVRPVRLSPKWGGEPPGLAGAETCEIGIANAGGSAGRGRVLRFFAGRCRRMVLVVAIAPRRAGA
jgi:hypothetical protein